MLIFNFLLGLQSRAVTSILVLNDLFILRVETPSSIGVVSNIKQNINEQYSIAIVNAYYKHLLLL